MKKDIAFLCNSDRPCSHNYPAVFNALVNYPAVFNAAAIVTRQYLMLQP